ncbi:MAG: single-stranded DNA-binding protein, partial [Actinomycetota bacterium]|nr:single-stranded DNA-binding protein [Actinomycetota bacterium]
MSETQVVANSAGNDGADAEVEDADAPEADGVNALLVQEGDIADYDGDIDLDVENDRAIVAIVGTDLQPLVGNRGETLDALQELTRLAV